jgi:hypothetical protein
MKKMMTLALGLSLFSGSALFAEGRPAPRGRNDARNDKGRNNARKDNRHDDRRGAHNDGRKR